MGLSIHYNGRFGNPELLQQMIEEVEDIVTVYNWKYTIRNTKFPIGSFESETHDNKLYGISFTPPDCETVSLCFLSNGRISSAALLHFYSNSTNESIRQYLYMVSVKTQFAGVQTHLFIIGLLKYLSKKYFAAFNVHDEGHYWQTNDQELLQQNFSRYNKLLDTASTAFESFPVKRGETIKGYIERMMVFVNQKIGKD